MIIKRIIMLFMLFVLVVCSFAENDEDVNSSGAEGEGVSGQNPETGLPEGVTIEEEEDKAWGFTIYPYSLVGASIIAGYKNDIENRDLFNGVVLGAGIGWGFHNFYRDFDGNLLTSDNTSGIDITKDTAYYNLNIFWLTGFHQGLVWNKKLKQNLMEYFVYYKGMCDINFEKEDQNELIFNQNYNLPDRKGIVLTSFVTGFLINTIETDDASKLKKGIYSEVSFEWGPFFMNNKADYIRANFQFKSCIPLVEAKLSKKGRNRFSMYIADLLDIDYLYGDKIPVSVRQTLGGLGARPGLGGSIRGSEAGRYDSRLKILNSLDLRMNLPAIGHKDIIPGFVLFFDAGYYNLIKGSDGGFLFSTGFGFYVDLFSFAQITLYCPQVLINEEKLNGKKVTPVAFGMAFHF